MNVLIVVVNIIGNRIGDHSSNPELDCLMFTSC